MFVLYIKMKMVIAEPQKAQLAVTEVKLAMERILKQ